MPFTEVTRNALSDGTVIVELSGGYPLEIEANSKKKKKCYYRPGLPSSSGDDRIPE